MKTRLILPVLATAFFLAAGAYAQNTQTVILARRGDVVSNSLTKATNFFVKDVALGESERAKIKAQGNFSPQISKLKFFYGENAAGSLVGTVLFLKMETQYGLIEVGIAFSPGGAVSNVVVTRATVQTEPWVKAAEKAGVLKHFNGISSNSEANPLAGVSKSELGAMPYFAAQVIATAVVRGVVYYNMLFQGRLQ